jgi:hypothetical protein
VGELGLRIRRRPLLLLLIVGEGEGNEHRYFIVWRAVFALGAVPPLAIFWFRMGMAVATAYRKSAMRKQCQPYLLAVKRYWRPLVGVSSCWFLYN